MSEAEAPPTAEAEGAPQAEARPSQDGEEPSVYYGRVKSYNYDKGFGFLDAPDLKPLFSKDVFLRKKAVADELLLSRIESGSGPKAAVHRGDIYVRFSLLVNEAGSPEAREVQEVKASEIPEEVLARMPAVEPLAPKAAPAKSGKKGAGKGGETAAGDEPRDEMGGSRKRSSKTAGKDAPAGGLLVGPHRCRVGKNAENNWEILRAAKSKHWFFHLTDYPSAYVILECEKEPTEEEKRRAAEVCRENSKMKLSGAIEVDATTCANVSFGKKGDAVGECSYKKDKLVEVILLPALET